MIASVFSKKFRQLLIRVSPYLILLLLGVMLVRFAWFKEGQPLLGGDIFFDYYPTDLPDLTNWLSSWQGRYLGGQPNALSSKVFPLLSFWYISRYAGVSFVDTEILWFSFVFCLSGVSMVYLVRTLTRSSKFIPEVLGGLFYMTNLYVTVHVTSLQYPILLSYAVSPLLLALFIKITREKSSSIRYSLLFGLSSLLVMSSAINPPTYFIAFIPTILYAIISLVYFKDRFTLVKSYALTFIIFVAINSFWIIGYLLSLPGSPFVGDYMGDYAVGGLDQVIQNIRSSSEFSTVFNNIGLIGKWGWTHSTAGSLHYPYSVLYSPGPLILPVYFLSMISLSALIFANKNRKITMFFGMTFLLGVFLASGSNAPFGDLYLFLVTYFPGFWVFRESFPRFAPLVALSLASMLALLLYSVQNLNLRTVIQTRLVKKRYLKLAFQKKIKRVLLYVFILATAICIILSALPLYDGSAVPDRKGKLPTTVTEVPPYWGEMSSVLNSLNPDSRILVLPYHTAYHSYSWGNFSYYGRDITPYFTRTDIISPYTGGGYSSPELSQSLINYFYTNPLEDYYGFAILDESTFKIGNYSICYPISESKEVDVIFHHKYDLKLNATEYQYFEFWAKSSQNVSISEIALSTKGAWDNTYKLDEKVPLLGGSWTKFVIPYTCFEKIGNPTWADVSRIKIKFLSESSGGYVWIDGIGFSTYDQPLLSITAMSETFYNIPSDVYYAVYSEDTGWADNWSTGGAFEQLNENSQNMTFEFERKNAGNAYVIIGTEYALNLDLAAREQVHFTLGASATGNNITEVRMYTSDGNWFVCPINQIIQSNDLLNYTFPIDSFSVGAGSPTLADINRFVIRISGGSTNDVVQSQGFGVKGLRVPQRTSYWGGAKDIDTWTELNLPLLLNLPLAMNLFQSDYILYRADIDWTGFGSTNMGSPAMIHKYLDQVWNGCLSITFQTGNLTLYKYDSDSSRVYAATSIWFSEEGLASLSTFSNPSLMNNSAIVFRDVDEKSFNNTQVFFGHENDNSSTWSLVKTSSTNYPQISYIKKASTEYTVKVSNATSPFVLVFSESFAPGWRAKIDGTLLESNTHIVVNGYCNGWLINKPGDYAVSIYYEPETYFDIGLIISSISIITCAVALIFRSVLRRTNVFFHKIVVLLKRVMLKTNILVSGNK